LTQKINGICKKASAIFIFILVMLNLFQHPALMPWIPGQARNDKTNNLSF